MRYRVAIPKAYVDEYTSGECETCCPFLHADGYCELGVEIKKDGVCSPGPKCVPGEYKLVPADAFLALQDEVERLRVAMRSICAVGVGAIVSICWMCMRLRFCSRTAWHLLRE